MVVARSNCSFAIEWQSNRSRIVVVSTALPVAVTYDSQQRRRLAVDTLCKLEDGRHHERLLGTLYKTHLRPFATRLNESQCYNSCTGAGVLYSGEQDGLDPVLCCWIIILRGNH